MRQLLWEELQELTTSETVLCARLSCLRSAVNEDFTCNGGKLAVVSRTLQPRKLLPKFERHLARLGRRVSSWNWLTTLPPKG